MPPRPSVWGRASLPLYQLLRHRQPFNVTLVNLRQEPIKQITVYGIVTDKRTVDIDVIVFATASTP